MSKGFFSEKSALPFLSLYSDSFAPDSFAPDSFAPDSFAPDSFAPDSFVPDSFVPGPFASDAFTLKGICPECIDCGNLSLGFCPKKPEKLCSSLQVADKALQTGKHLRLVKDVISVYKKKFKPYHIKAIVMQKNDSPLFSRQEIVLLFITVIWGATFLIIRHGLQSTGPLFFVGIRFTCATIMMAVLSFSALPKLTRHELYAGLVIGIVLFGSYSFQTIGLQYITASKSAFITAAYVPIVPILQWLFIRQAPGILMWTGVILTFAGLILLAGPDGVSVGYGIGEMFTMLSALSIALEILLISFFARSVNTRRITIVQVAVVAVAAFALMPIFGEEIPPFSWTIVWTACSLGIATGLIQYAMNWAQKSISPTRATLIYAGEPVWAGIFGRLAGERLPHTALLGGVLVVLGVIVSSLKRRSQKG